MRFLKRCLSLVFQRLARSSEGWGSLMIDSLLNILTFVENRRLCANVLVLPHARLAASAASPAPGSSPSPLLDFDDAPAVGPEAGSVGAGVVSVLQQTPDERQILCFLMDMMSSLRKAASNGALDGDERRALGLSLRITLGCLRCASEATADRIFNEVLAQLQFMSEPWGARSADDYVDFLLLVFSQLQGAICDPAVPTNIKDRYSALTYRIIHHHMDLRFRAQNEVSQACIVFFALYLSSY